MTNLFTNLLQKVVISLKWTKWTKWTEQIFVESAESAKSAKPIFATSATFASANFVGKASNESTVMDRVKSRIPSCLFRYSLDSILSRFSLASLICVCMLTVGVGNAWGVIVKDTIVVEKFGGSTSTSYVETETSGSTKKGVTAYMNNWNPANSSSKTQIRVNKGTAGTDLSNQNFYVYNDGAMPGNITNVELIITTGSTTERYFQIASSTSSKCSSTPSYNESNKGSHIGSTNSLQWTFAESRGIRYFRISCSKNGGTVKASYVVITYVYHTVTYNGNGNTGGTAPTDATKYLYNADVDTKANSGTLAKTGFTFSGWNTKADGTGTTFAASTSKAFKITKDTTLYAKWTAAASCTADPTIGNASLNGSFSLSSIPLSISSVGGGTDCTLAEYGFVWKASSAPSASDNKTKIGESSSATSFTGNITGSFSTGVTYYIKGYAINNGPNTTLSSTALTITPQSVTFNSNGGSSVSTAYVNNGATVSKPSDPTKTGYTFGDWYTDNGTFASAVNWSSNITSNQTYYAKWTAKTTTISFNQTSGTGGQTGTLTATYGSAMPSAPVTVPTRDGYDFGGYYDGSGGTGTQYYTNTGASARNWDKEDATYTLHAKWTVKTTTVSFNQNGGDGGQTSSLTATYGSAMPTPITKPTRDGYIFDGYYESTGGTGTKYYNANGTSATNWDKEDATWTLYAKWVDKGCTTHNGTNVVSGTSKAYEYGPVDPYWEYSTRQILYTKTDLGLAAGKKGTIKALSFQYAHTTGMTGTNSVKIYMAHTTLTSLSTTGNYITSFTKVYEGAMNCSGDEVYNEFMLDTPFEYNGVDNLIVVIVDESNKDEGSSSKFYYHEANTLSGDYAQLYKHSTSAAISPTETTTWTGATATNNRPNTKFCIQESDMPTYTVNWYVNDNVTPAHSQTTYEGATLTGIPTPTKSDCDDSKDFVGWYTSTYSDEDDAPDYVSPTTMPNGGGNYYAIFATGTPGFDGYKYIGDNVLLTEGKTYIFVTSTSAGSAYALKSSDLPLNDASGKVGTAVSVTVASGSKISTENTDLEFTCTSHTTTVGEELDVLKIGSTNNTLRISGWGVGYGDARAYYDEYDLYGWNNAGEIFYDVYYNSSAGNFQKMENAATRVYAYEKLTTIYSDFVTLCCTPHNVTLASSGSVTGGTFTSSVNRACATKSVTLTATPSNSGYVFNGWTVTNSSTSANVTTTVLGAGHANDNPATMTMPDYNVTVTAAFSAISSISVKTAPTKTVYLEGETFDPTGLVITATYANSATVDVPYLGNEASFTFSPTTATSLTTSHTAVTITYSGETVNQSISVYSVTRQALDEQGNAIADGGPGSPTFTVATRGISPAADAANYKFKQWTISGASLGSAATTKGNTITNPTGNVIVTAVYYLPRTVTWLVNGEEWKPYTDTGKGTDGTAVVTKDVAWSTLTLPTDPNPLNDEGCGQKFIGWVAAPITGELDKDDDAAAITVLDIMTSANQSTKTGAGHNVNNNITFYAVFADYVE